MDDFRSPHLFNFGGAGAIVCLFLLTAVPGCAQEEASVDEWDTIGCAFFDRMPSYDSVELARLLEYPKVARRKGLEGEVIVSVKVGTKGEALKAVVRRSSDMIFEANALDVVWKLHYVPATQNGLAITAWKTFAIAFSLNENDKPDSVEVETEEEPREYGMDEYAPGATLPSYDRGQLKDFLEVPDVSRDRCGSWSVAVSAKIDRDGTILQTVVRSATDTLFIEPTIKAIRRITFTPGMKNGEPIRMWITLPINIELED